MQVFIVGNIFETIKALDKKKTQKAKEVFKMAEMSYCAAIGAYRNIGGIFEDCKQKMIE
jgi:hypothetical protein